MWISSTLLGLAATLLISRSFKAIRQAAQQYMSWDLGEEMVSPDSPCPDNLTHGDKMKHFHVGIQIHAPAPVVWRLLTGASAYTHWNAAVEKIEGQIALGQKIKVFPAASPNRAFPAEVIEFHAMRRMVWTGGMPFGLFRGDRVFELEPVTGGVHFYMREDFTGTLSAVICRLMPDLQPSFDQFARSLRDEAESQVVQRASKPSASR